MVYRPDFETQCVVKVEDIEEPKQSWAEDEPIGSHRVKAAWAEKRCDGVKDGIAVEPNWEGSGPGVEKIEDMMDTAQRGTLCNGDC